MRTVFIANPSFLGFKNSSRTASQLANGHVEPHSTGTGEFLLAVDGLLQDGN
jgi:hypothetical protein